MGTTSGCACRTASRQHRMIDRVPVRRQQQCSVGKEDDGSSLQTPGLAALQCTLWILWHTCRIINWCSGLVGSKVGCTWVTMRAVVGSPVESALNVLLVFCVLVECARFGRQQGHVVTERVQWSTVTRGGRLTELLCYLCNVQNQIKKKIRFYTFIYTSLIYLSHIPYLYTFS